MLAKRTVRGRLLLRALQLSQHPNRIIEKSALILNYAHESGSALLKAFEIARRERAASRGMTTDEEQDLLRAMLIIGAAGLDAMLKQLIRDSMPILAKMDKAVLDELEKFVARQIRGDVETTDVTAGTRFLARILAAPEQQKQVIEEYIKELTGGSLQSSEELMRTVRALGIEPGSVGAHPQKLKPIFEIRNKIVHEMDIDLTKTRRKRNLRRSSDMIKYVDSLLEIAEKILHEVDRKSSQSI
jgi:hypothetical protein